VKGTRLPVSGDSQLVEMDADGKDLFDFVNFIQPARQVARDDSFRPQWFTKYHIVKSSKNVFLVHLNQHRRVISEAS
jgi:hypothetical protein